MSNRDIGKLYQSGVSKKQFKKPRERFDEATVVVKYEDGNKEKFTLDDAYVRSLSRRIAIDNGTFEESLKKIMINGGWGDGQENAIKNFKSVVINTSYTQSVELVQWLSNNKSDTVSLKDIFVEDRVVNFADVIANKLPQEFTRDIQGLKQFIMDVHFNVVPKAATNVGLGEGTFSIFGTATKGNSGDLQWDGKEVEIKTNGTSDAGAVLGGDRTMILNAINDLENLKGGSLKYGGHFYISTLNDVLSKLDEIASLYTSGDVEGSTAAIEGLKVMVNSDIFKSHFQSMKFINAINDVNSIEDLKSTRTKAYKLSTRGTLTLFDAIRDNINSKISKLQLQSQNWISQVNTYLALCDTDEERIAGFSKIRTDGKCDLSGQIKNFFIKYDVNQFLPTVNYDNFSRLIGCISLLCYKNKINYDIITAGNDKTGTMIFIDCNRTLSELFEHLTTSNLPVIFDLNVDVYDMGSDSSRSQTVFATAPRIKLK